MAGEPKDDREGIRFLDEEPKPTRPEAASRTKPNPKRREWPVGVTSFLIVVGVGIAMKWGGGPGRVGVESVIEERFEVGPAPRIEVEAFEGSIRVERGEGRSVSCRVKTTARGRSEEEARLELGRLRASVDGGREAVRVRVDRPRGPAPWSGRSEVRLEVPADADVRIATGDGKVRVERVRGSIAVRTDNGRIEVERGGGPIVLRTSNGAIDCEATDAVVSAETANGAITFRGSLAPGTSRLVAGNGSVRLRLPEHARYRIVAESRNGRVDSDFPIGRAAGAPAVVVARFEDEPEARVEVRTGNGSIRVEKD